MSDDKRWALEVSDEDFPTEYQRRNPRSDVIPDRLEWLSTLEVEDLNIEPVKESELVVEDPKPIDLNDKELPTIGKHGEIVRPDGIFGCGGGCGFETKTKLVIFNHQRRCAEFLNKKDK